MGGIEQVASGFNEEPRRRLPGQRETQREGLALLAATMLDVRSASLMEPKNHNGPTRRCLGPHIFDRICNEYGVEHKLAEPCHPWTNGQAERMNRTVKEAATKAFHYPDLESLKAHVLAFVSAHNAAPHLKALRWRTPFEAVCHAWTTTPMPSSSTRATSSRDQTPS